MTAGRQYSLSELLSTIPQVGRLEWIGLRPAHRAPITLLEEVLAQTDRGLDGDRSALSVGGTRQVTLIQAEHLSVIAALCGIEHRCDPSLLRRNLVVSDINLLALKDKPFLIGMVTLEGTGLCHPCSRMEEALGPGGYNAVRGHGGITARIVEGGVLRIGDEVRLIR